jgi:hypothetical protein
MRLTRRALLAAASCGVIGAARAARAGDADDVVARIGRARERVRTLQGPFTQTRTIGLLATEVRSKGTLTLVRPDRLRWELAPPDDVVFWIGPEGLAYRSAHGRGRVPASSARVAAALDDLRTLLGGDLGRLSTRWSLRVLRDDAQGVELDAQARAQTAGGVQSMRFALGPDLVRPTRVLLVEGPADRTAVDFGQLAVDAPVDDARMRPG